MKGRNKPLGRQEIFDRLQHETRISMIRKASGRTPTMVFEVNCAGIHGGGLYDTGAMVSLMSRSFHERLGTPPLWEYHKRMVGANGVPLQAFGVCRLKVTMESLTLEHPFIVVEDLQYDMILGMDLIFEHRISLEVGTGGIILRKDQAIVAGQVLPEWVEKSRDEAWSVGSIQQEENVLFRERLIAEFKNTFKTKADPLTQTSKFEAYVEVIGPPIRAKEYPMSAKNLKILRKILGRMLEAGIIVRVEDAEWTHPCFLVGKGKTPDLDNEEHWRLVNDTRPINARTNILANPLPRIEDIIDRAAGAKYFTVLDLRSGFWQCKYAKGCGKYFCFVADGQTYMPTSMLMGAVNSPGAFQAFVRATLGALWGSFVDAYIDDIIIYSDTLEEHEHHVRQVVRRLEAFEWSISTEKSVFAAREVDYLGHRLMGQGIVKPKDANLKQILIAEPFQSREEAQEFVGRAGYYRRFVPGFATRIKPINEAIHAPGVFQMNEEVEGAMTWVVMEINRLVQLNVPKEGQPFNLAIAADHGAIGCVLSQTGMNGVEGPIGFASTLLQGPELNYNAVEKSMMAVRLGLRKWRHHLSGRKVKVFTRDKHLSWAMSTSTRHVGRLRKWLYEWGDIELECTKTEHQCYPAELLLGRRPMEPVSGANGGNGMQWPVMDTEAVILSSDGGDRDRKVSGYGFVVWNEDGSNVMAVGAGASSDGSGTVNIQEATGLLAGLEKALAMGKRTVVAFMDSKLIRNLVYNVYTPKNETLRKLIVQIQETLGRFETWIITYVAREWNEVSDWVANCAMDQLMDRQPGSTIKCGVGVSLEDVVQWIEANQPRLPWQAPMIPIYTEESDQVVVGVVQETELMPQGTEMLPPALVRIRQGQMEIMWMRTFVKYLEGSQELAPPKIRKEDAFNYCMQGGVLCKLVSNQAFNVRNKIFRPLIVVPNSLRQQLVKEAHDSSEASHGGVAETYHVLLRSFWWPGMWNDVHEMVRSCPRCQAAKGPITVARQPLARNRMAYGPMDLLAVDFIELPHGARTLEGEGRRRKDPDKYGYILVVQDVFSRYVWAFPAVKADGMETARLLQERIFDVFGAPRLLTSDQGFAFTARVVEAIMLMNNVTHCFTTAYHPQANPVERVNRVIKERLRAVCKDTNDWPSQLGRVINAFNRSIHSSTQYAPFTVFFGRDPVTPTMRMMSRGGDSKYNSCREFLDKTWSNMAGTWDNVVQASHSAWVKAKRAYDTRYDVWKKDGSRRAFEYKIGDLVWIARPMRKTQEGALNVNLGLVPRWYGPLRVLSRTGGGGDTYRVGYVQGGVLPMPYHANLLRPYVGIGPQERPPRPGEVVDDSTIDWNAPFEEVIDRHKRIAGPRSVRSGKVEREVIETRMSGAGGGYGVPRREWKVRYDDGQCLWVDDSQIQTRKLVNDYRAISGMSRAKMR